MIDQYTLLIILAEIVRIPSMGESEPINNRLLKESPHFGFSNFGKHLSLHPLREMVNGN